MSAISGYGHTSYYSSRGTVTDRDKQQEIRRQYGYSDRDHVSIYTLPKKEIGKKFGSMRYKPVSMKAQKLRNQSQYVQKKIASIERSDLPAKEKHKRLWELRCELKYINCKLNTEVASTPTVGIIVLEEDEEEE